MNTKIIPIENWLGVFKNDAVENITASNRRFVSGECFRVKDIGVPFPGYAHKESSYTTLAGGELVLGINNILNTDVICWPEGIKEDFSNIHLQVNPENGKDQYVVFIDDIDVEDKEYLTIKTKTTGELTKHPFVVFVLEAKFDVFIDSTDPVFVDFITEASETSIALASGKAIAGNITADSPNFIISVIPEEELNGKNSFIYQKQANPLALVIGAVRYVNKITQNIIHEDMIPFIRNVWLVVNKEGDEEIVLCFDFFGKIYAVSSLWDPKYEFPVEELPEEE